MIQSRAPFIRINNIILKVDAIESIYYDEEKKCYEICTPSADFDITDEEEIKHLEFLLHIFTESFAIMDLKNVYERKDEIEKAVSEIKSIATNQYVPQNSSNVIGITDAMSQEEKIAKIRQKIKEMENL